MRRHRTPLSERVLSAMTIEDEELVREIEALERMAGAEVTHVAVNGRHPRDWSVERWLTVITFVCTMGGGIWFASGAWSGVQQDIRGVKSDLASVRTSLDQLTRNVERDRLNAAATAEENASYVRDAMPPARPASRGRSVGPQFPRDQQFRVEPGRPE